MPEDEIIALVVDDFARGENSGRLVHSHLLLRDLRLLLANFLFLFISVIV